MPELPKSLAERTLEMMPGLACHVDSSGHFTWLGGQWSEALGHEKETLLGRSCFELIHPSDLPGSVEALSNIKVNQRVSGFENRYLHANGSTVWLRWNACISEGLIIASAMVVTHERSRDEALRDQRDLLRLSEEIGGLGHWRIKLKDGTIYWSPQTFRLHGLEPRQEQPTMEEALAFFHAEDRETVQGHIQRSLESGEGFDFELRLLRADRAERIVRSRGIVSRGPDGEPEHLIGSFQDITQARMLQRRLQDSERLGSINALAAGIAHELNNPLQYIFANIGMAKERVEEMQIGNESPQARELSDLLSDARHGLEQVARVIGDLKSCIEHSPEQLPRALDLSEVIQATINISASEVKRSATFTEELSAVPPVRADFAEMIQVLVNLLNNACQAVAALGPERARVTIRSRTGADGWALVEVQDNGAGVPVRDQSRIFEPFHTTKPLGVGGGLGLHISRSIVERRGGRIELSSEPGCTVFRVCLPPAARPEEAASAPALPRALIVDDDARVARTVARMLHEHFECLVVNDAFEALKHLSAEPFDLVVCDVMMPGMTGWELLRAAALVRPSVLKSTLMMSGDHPDKYRPEDLPEMPYLEKPFGPAELRSFARALSGGPHSA